jgi:hypothetical protein
VYAQVTGEIDASIAAFESDLTEAMAAYDKAAR